MVFQTALSNAKSVIDNEDASQDDVDNALLELQSAIDNLQEDYVVSITATATETEYNTEEEIDKSTITVERVYYSGKTEILSEDEFEIDPTIAPDTEGEFEVIITDIETGLTTSIIMNVTAFLKPLAKCSVADIQAIAQSGLAEECWSVGDTYPITLNGTVGIYDFDNGTWYAYIIGFNHNADIETEGLPNVAFQFGKTEDGIEIAFVDDQYNTSHAGSNFTGFVMNHSATNTGGWESSYMRNTICQEFLEAMPQEWQDIIKPTIKYTDNVGGGSGNVESNVTATEDKIFLLSQYEIREGNTSIANRYEDNYNELYSYYSAGINAKYKHSDPETICLWSTRSCARSGSSYFAYINDSGSVLASSNNSHGFAPAFTIF